MAAITQSAFNIESDGRRSVFRGKGQLNMSWLTECFQLFKKYRIVIRELTIYPEFHSINLQTALTTWHCLSITFDTPAESSEFLECFLKQLELIQWAA